MKKAASYSAALAGFTAMASQIVLVREFLTTFYGNELSVGFILASWLMAGAIGSFLAGRVADSLSVPVVLISLCQSAVALALPSSIVAIRCVKSALGITTGAIVPFFPMAVSSFVILLPLCGLLGFIFSLSCRVYGPNGSGAAEGIGRIYVAESAGAIAGGLLVSFVLIKSMDPVGIMAALTALNLAAAGWLAISAGISKLKALSLLAAAAGIAIAALMWPLGGWEGLRSYSMARLWNGYELIDSRNSVYGNIALARCAEEISFFDNGLHLYTVPDRESREETAHFALLEHPAPQTVLLVGGGVSGLINEIAKHGVKRIDYVELDPLIIEMARENLPVKYTDILKDRRVGIKNTDGRLFVKSALTVKHTPGVCFTVGEEVGVYDCVIVNVGDPSTAQLNRFYTLEFFGEVKRILKRGGVLSFALSSSENYINDELKDFLGSIYATLKKVFPDVKVMPGSTVYFLASDGAEPLTYDYKTLMSRARSRNIDVKYVREYYLFSKLSPERTDYTEERLKAARPALNRDFRPLGYYYYSIYWMSHFRDSIIKNVLKSVTPSRLAAAAAVTVLIIYLYGMKLRRASVMALAVTGASSMVFQMVILLSFQIIYGYMFYKMGVILTTFMAGLLLGGMLAVKTLRSGLGRARLFPLSMCAVAAYAAVLPPAFVWLASGRSAFTAWFGPNIMFMLLPAAAGFLGGLQFPLANRMYLASPAPFDRSGLGYGAGRSAGINYGADLAGAAVGALITGAFLIPVAGIPATCLMVAAAKLAAASVLFKAPVA